MCLNSKMDRLLYIVTKARHEQSTSNRTITPKVQKRGLKIVPYCLSVCVCVLAIDPSVQSMPGKHSPIDIFSAHYKIYFRGYLVFSYLYNADHNLFNQSFIVYLNFFCFQCSTIIRNR